jgi:chromosome partitioning protein
MPVIVVANPKGGVGKSTLATNLAGYFAAQAHAIATWEVSADHIARPPKDVSHVVLDTPAGLHGWRLNDALKMAHKIIVPLQPSMFDILATQDFLRRLADERAVREGGIDVGIVGMRVDARTRSAEQLQRFIEGLNLPVVGYLRNTQNYVQLAAHGLSLWDVAPGRVQRDLEQWQQVIDWIDKGKTKRQDQ